MYDPRSILKFGAMLNFKDPTRKEVASYTSKFTYVTTAALVDYLTLPIIGLD